MSRYAGLIGLILLIAGLSGCASSRAPGLGSDIHPFTTEEREIWDSVQTAEYTIRNGDEFKLSFKYIPQLDQSNLIVLPDGRITPEGLAPTQAAGLTISELDSTLTVLYARDYIDPDLSIIITHIGQAGVYILGEVVNPGLVMLPNSGPRLLHAISEAGGFTDSASTSEVLHVRVTPEGYRYRHIDLSHLEKRDFMTGDVLDLQPYDLVYVPRSGAGDIANFSRQILSSTLSVTNLFWDIYAMLHIDKVDRLVR